MKEAHHWFAFIAGILVAMFARCELATAHADDGHVEALREIARAIESKDCK